jgi:hypothetical protein
MKKPRLVHSQNSRVGSLTRGGMDETGSDCALLTVGAARKSEPVEVELCGKSVAVFVDDDLGESLPRSPGRQRA